MVGYEGSSGVSKSLEVVDAAIAYDGFKGERVILVINQALEVPGQSNNLLCPMQLRVNDVEVDEKPKFLTDQPGASDHAIVIRDNSLEKPFIIPLSIHGVTFYFPSRKPTLEEYEDNTLLHLSLTYDTPIWDPHDSSYQPMEEAMTDTDGMVVDPDPKGSWRIAFTGSQKGSCICLTDDGDDSTGIGTTGREPECPTEANTDQHGTSATRNGYSD